MPYEFSIPHPVRQKSLVIAMQYLEQTGQVYLLSQTKRFCADVIYQEWKTGRRHPVWLGNKAIRTLEQAREAHWFRLLYEPVTASPGPKADGSACVRLPKKEGEHREVTQDQGKS